MSVKRTTCRQCGKEFTVTYPAHWAYRDGKTYFCSWKCIRAHDAGQPPTRDGVEAVPTDALTPEQMAAFQASDERAKKSAMRCVVGKGKEKKPVKKRATEAQIMEKLAELKRLREEGCNMRAAAEKLGVSHSTLDRWVALYGAELGLRRMTQAEKVKRMNEVRMGVGVPNHSGEKTGKISAALSRLNILMAELNEEVRAYAGR